MYADWALPGREATFLPIAEIARELMSKRVAKIVRHKDICSKPGDWHGHNDFEGPRFEKADTRFPGMIVEGMPNPCNRRYRMIDGRRRKEKMERMGYTKSRHFIFDYDEIAPYIREFRLTE